ncbi:MAG TPA: hypothetical protein VG184_02715 [Acidimicrobiales bacterium]|jgi:hypothetical protein|nr:hypothetical protein [Acidimicrobiales bacterium]
MRLPIDTGALSFICAGAPEAVVDYDTRRPKTDEAGMPLYSLPVVAMSDGTAEVISVKVAGEPKTATPGSALRLVGLVALPWAMGDRSGVAYRAARVEITKPEPRPGT